MTPQADMSDALMLGDQSRRSADCLYDQGEYGEAEAVYLRLLAEDLYVGRSWIYFQLGRVALRLNRAEEAVLHFDRALAEPDPLPWVYYERSQALRAAGGALEAIVADIQRFIMCAPEALAAGHYGDILLAAHDAFKAGWYEDAKALYDFLASRSQFYYTSQIRVADISIIQGAVHHALEVLDAIRNDSNYDEWGDFLTAKAYYKIGQFEDAASFFYKALVAQPNNPYFQERLLASVRRIVPKVSFEVYVQYIDVLPDEKRQEFLVLWYMQEGNLDACRAHLNCLSDKSLEAIAPIIVEFINHLKPGEDFGLIETIVEATRAIELGLCTIVCAVLTAYFRTRRWSDAAALLARSEQNPEFLRDPEFWLRQLEYFCYTLRYDRALTHLASYAKDCVIPASATAIITALYASLGRWDDVMDFVLSRAEGKFPIQDNILLESATRATRHTRRYEDALHALNVAIEHASHPNLVNRRDHLIEELRLMELLEPGQFETVDAGLNDIVPLRATRSDMMVALLTQSNKVPGPKSIFLCTDRKYLIGCCVAIYALIRNNIPSCKLYNITVFCDNDCLVLASEIFRRIEVMFCCPIQVNSTSKVVNAEHRFMTRWGTFTPDQGLSNAAYYRLYAAKHLLRSSVGGRALYLDSDTIVTSFIDRLLDWDLEGLPMGAHRDRPNALIEAAAERLGVDPETYFNSGVMLFDLDHPDLGGRLDHAIDFAVSRPHLLTFLDQCALNGAFYGGVSFLPEDFNYFVRPAGPLPRFVVEPLIWHFLEAPKPWDPLYATHNGDRWYQEFVGFADCVGDRCLRELLSSQFPMQHAVLEGASAQP